MISTFAHGFVVTGGPGAGKTTLLDQLAGRGHAHSLEAGRAIIEDQSRIGGPALPWADRSLFAELMLGWEMRSLRLAAGEPPGRPFFFDRGLPDIVGYLRLEGLPVPPHVEEAARSVRYNGRVFIAPHWPQIYTTDSERRQDPATAQRTCAVMVEVYGAFGYDLVEIPRVSPAQRADFVLARVLEAMPPA